MKLHTYFRSSAAYRVRIALNVKRLAFDLQPENLPRGEHRADRYLALNPQGLVPLLEAEGDTVAQSLAIIEYLEERYPAPPLLPSEPLARAHVRAMALAVACDLHPLNNLRVLNYLRVPLGHDEAAVTRWIQHWIAEGFRALEVLVRRYSGDSRHCFGTTVTLADVCLVPQMYNARRFECDLAPYPTLVAIDAALREKPEFLAAAPERQPDAG